MNKAFIIDIDNCWMDSRLWLSKVPYGSEKESDWESFYRRVFLCKPNKPFIDDILEVIEKTNLYPLFVTSRSGSVVTQTILQIQKHSPLKVGYTCGLYMRPSKNDYRSSEKVKKSILLNLMKEYEIIYAIDDTHENLTMYKECGVPHVLHYDIETHDYTEI